MLEGDARLGAVVLVKFCIFESKSIRSVSSTYGQLHSIEITSSGFCALIPLLRHLLFYDS